MATIGHKFKKALLSYDRLSQREILDNVQTEALKRDETAFYSWVQQICFVRINTVDDTDFANNWLWNELINHLDSEAFKVSAASM